MRCYGRLAVITSLTILQTRITENTYFPQVFIMIHKTFFQNIAEMDVMIYNLFIASFAVCSQEIYASFHSAWLLRLDRNNTKQI